MSCSTFSTLLIAPTSKQSKPTNSSPGSNISWYHSVSQEGDDGKSSNTCTDLIRPRLRIRERGNERSNISHARSIGAQRGNKPVYEASDQYRIN